MICRQLFAGHVVGSWPMNKKKKNALNDNLKSCRTSPQAGRIHRLIVLFANKRQMSDFRLLAKQCPFRNTRTKIYDVLFPIQVKQVPQAVGMAQG